MVMVLKPEPQFRNKFILRTKKGVEETLKAGCWLQVIRLLTWKSNGSLSVHTTTFDSNGTRSAKGPAPDGV